MHNLWSHYVKAYAFWVFQYTEQIVFMYINNDHENQYHIGRCKVVIFLQFVLHFLAETIL